MQGVRARLESHVGHSSGCASQLCFEIVRRNVDRLDRLRWRYQYLQEARPLVVFDALELIEVPFPRQTIDFCLQGILCVEELRVLKNRGRRTWNHVE